MSPCPGCGWHLARGTACPRCRLAPRPAGAGPRLAPPKAPPGAAPRLRVQPSGWTPRAALWLEGPGEVRAGAGPPRPVPCPDCGARLAAHGQRCSACARAARAARPAPARVGSAPRLKAPLGPPGADARPRIEPTTWKPKNPLYLDVARIQVTRDQIHIFRLRAPSRPNPN